MAVLLSLLLKIKFFSMKYTGGNRVYLVYINFHIKYEKFGKPRTHKLQGPFLMTVRLLFNQGTIQRILSYVYIRFWDNITSLIKMFLVCNPVSQFIFFVHYILSKHNFFLHRRTKVHLLPGPVHFLYTQTLVYFLPSSREEPRKFL